jgi:hypothetical protein
MGPLVKFIVPDWGIKLTPAYGCRNANGPPDYLGSVVFFIVPDWGDDVDSGIGLLYRPAKLHRLNGPIRQPYAGVNFIPLSGTMNLVTSPIYEFDNIPWLNVFDWHQ